MEKIEINEFQNRKIELFSNFHGLYNFAVRTITLGHTFMYVCFSFHSYIYLLIHIRFLNYPLCTNREENDFL